MSEGRGIGGFAGIIPTPAAEVSSPGSGPGGLALPVPGATIGRAIPRAVGVSDPRAAGCALEVEAHATGKTHAPLGPKTAGVTAEGRIPNALQPIAPVPALSGAP